MFKICLEYWNFFVPDVYSSVCTIEPSSTAMAQVGAGAWGGAGIACLAWLGWRWNATSGRAVTSQTSALLHVLAVGLLSC